ncbi:hypothetical protein SCP_0404050 [Sparassis crispa]|uniref:Uncharacterized protein n=1 Tax=Sparassis crispa TaxID=139825 RepID=A0A401GIM7_9APHY|nr:hypothetical protein SCP_0404050 [Sparassis crispa]GBE82029.1 hypothetical protein SCP_0404050 [Sparassis crispa]
MRLFSPPRRDTLLNYSDNVSKPPQANRDDLIPDALVPPVPVAHTNPFTSFN